MTTDRQTGGGCCLLLLPIIPPSQPSLMYYNPTGNSSLKWIDVCPSICSCGENAAASDFPLIVGTAALPSDDDDDDGKCPLKLEAKRIRVNICAKCDTL